MDKLPLNIEHLECLESLSLSDNNLIELDSSLFNLINLTKLYLDRNKLTSLPIEKIQECSKLNLLSLDGNPFSSETKELIQNKLNYWFGEI